MRTIWRLLALLAPGLWFGAGACRDESAADWGTKWKVVFRDSLYDVAIDTVGLVIPSPSHDFGTYEVRYRTEHHRVHYRNGQPWNRELITSKLWCERGRYKLIGIDLSHGDAKPISTQRASPFEVAQQQWRPVAVGTADEVTLRAACALITERKQRRDA